MINSDVFVGIDISQSYLDVFISTHRQSGHASHALRERFENNVPGIAQLISVLKEVKPKLVALESTGGLERLILCELHRAQMTVARLNPRQVRAYAVALGKAKTDSIDAKVLASFAQTVRPNVDQPLDENSQNLTDLVTRRRQLVEMGVAEKNHLSRSPDIWKKDLEEQPYGWRLLPVMNERNSFEQTKISYI